MSIRIGLLHNKKLVVTRPVGVEDINAASHDSMILTYYFSTESRTLLVFTICRKISHFQGHIKNEVKLQFQSDILVEIGC